MNVDEYTLAVRSVLDGHTPSAVANLTTTLGCIPVKASRVIIKIFIDQDGEGFLGVRINLEGPDLYVLNKAIRPSAELFSTKMIDGQLQPGLPLMEPHGESFSVHDALSDVAAQWIQEVWNLANHSDFSLPVFIETHDGYGTFTPLSLNHAIG